MNHLQRSSKELSNWNTPTKIKIRPQNYPLTLSSHHTQKHCLALVADCASILLLHGSKLLPVSTKITALAFLQPHPKDETASCFATIIG